MKIYYVANARMPQEKAHGIQIAKTIESFSKAEVDVVLVLPKRRRKPENIRKFYNLDCEVEAVYLPVLNTYLQGRTGFVIGSITFMLAYMVFFVSKLFKGKKFIIYTIDMDTFSSTLLTLLPRPCFSEMHGIRNSNYFTRTFFKNVTGVIVINEFIKETLIKTFGINDEKILVESNGVDSKMFTSAPKKQEARKKIGVPTESKIALYIGRFYPWKGLEILADAAGSIHGVELFVVGGTMEEYKEVTSTNNIPANLRFFGDKLPEEIPVWLSAADVLLVLGTKANDYSYYYTSPMKVFEYMAAQRPIVSSNTPAMNSILDAGSAYLYEPDNSESLVATITKAIATLDQSVTDSAYQKVLLHTWDNRAARIINFLSEALT